MVSPSTVEPAGSVWFEVQTSTALGTAGAIAIIQMVAPNRASLDSVLDRLKLPQLATGRTALCDLLGVDVGVVARVTDNTIQLMPHGGRYILHKLMTRLESAGVKPPGALRTDPLCRYPEAADAIEACAMDAIALAPSPRAVDAILTHADRWRMLDRHAPPAFCTPQEQCALDRLLVQPTVVLVGGANIGKSSLTNALAKRCVSIVADVGGTTRDHVGVRLVLDGLCVSWIDTPGFGGPESTIDSEAERLAAPVIASADLVLLCADAERGFVHGVAPEGATILRVGLRSDLGRAAGVEVQTSAVTGEGLDDLAIAIRRRLVPDPALSTSGLWRFHDALPGC